MYLCHYAIKTTEEPFADRMYVLLPWTASQGSDCTFQLGVGNKSPPFPPYQDWHQFWTIGHRIWSCQHIGLMTSVMCALYRKLCKSRVWMVHSKCKMCAKVIPRYCTVRPQIWPKKYQRHLKLVSKCKVTYISCMMCLLANIVIIKV